MATGHAFKDKGRKGWRARWELSPDPKTGIRRQRSKGGFRTRKEAEDYATNEAARVYRGINVDPKGLTIENYCTQWLELQKPDRSSGADDQLRVSTWTWYRNKVEKYIVPAIGRVKLRDLTRDDVLKLLNDGCPPRSRSGLHGTLRKLLYDAVASGYIVANPAARLGKRRQKSSITAAGRGMQTWSFEQLRTFLGVSDQDRLFALWRLIAFTGCRRGEGLGLLWSEVDLDVGQVTFQRGLVEGGVFEEPKTDSGRRTVDVETSVVTALGRWRRNQAEERLAAGPLWCATAMLADGSEIPNDLVFTREDGSTWKQPVVVSARFSKIVRRAGVRRIRLHDLRHTHATLLLKGGENPRVVHERLGHSDVSTTLRIYGHVLPSMGRRASEWFEAQLGSGPATSRV